MLNHFATLPCESVQKSPCLGNE